MSKLKSGVILFFAFIVASGTAYASGAGGILDALPNNSALFPGLAASPPMQMLSKLALLFGGVFLLWGHAARMDNVTRRGSAAGDDMLRNQIQTWVTLAAMLLSPFLLGTLANVSDGALRGSGVSGPAQINTQVALALNMMPDPNKLIQGNMAATTPKIAADGTVDESDVSWSGKAWDWLKDKATDAVNIAKGMGALLAKWGEYAIKAVFFILLYLLTLAFLLIAQLAIWSVEQVRFLILVIGGVILPLFVSAWGLNDGHWFQQSGRKVCLSLMCVALWPFAWIIFGLLSSAFIAAWAKALVGVGIWNNSSATLLAAGSIASGTTPTDIISGTEALVGNVIMNGLGPFLALTVGSVGLGLWLIIAPFKLPFLMQSMLLEGANSIMDGVIGGAKMAGKTAAVVASGGTAAAGAAMASKAQAAASASGTAAGSGLAGGKALEAMGQMMGGLASGNMSAAAGSAGKAMKAAAVYRARRAKESDDE